MKLVDGFWVPAAGWFGDGSPPLVYLLAAALVVLLVLGAVYSVVQAIARRDWKSWGLLAGLCVVSALGIFWFGVSPHHDRIFPPGQQGTGSATEPPGAPAKPGPGKRPSSFDSSPGWATTMPSGLSHVRLDPGTGAVRPVRKSRVTVKFTGWTSDGKQFASTTSSFRLDRVIKGWTEGVQLMVVGEKRRFWVPAQLAYGHGTARPGAPAGNLVFDIELLSFE